MTDRILLDCPEFRLLASSPNSLMKFDIDFGDADPSALNFMNGNQDMDITFDEYLKGFNINVQSGSPAAEKVYRAQFERFADNVRIVRGEIVSRYRGSELVRGKSSQEICSATASRGSNSLFAGGIFFCRGEMFKEALKVQSDFLKRLSGGEKEEVLRYIPDEYMPIAENTLFGRTFLVVEPTENKNPGCSMSFH